MKRFFNRCGRHRRDLCLLAAGALSEPDRDAILSHLAGCADCRKYCGEVTSVTLPLTNWSDHFDDLRPDPALQRRWARAIEAAGPPAPVRRREPAVAFRGWWREMIRPYRRVWAGLAVAWVLLLAVNVSMRDEAGGPARKSPSTPGMIAALKDQQKTLSELLGDQAALPEVDRPRVYLPKPRTERAQVSAV